MKLVLIMLMFAMFGLTMASIFNESCTETIAITPHNLPVDYRGWENFTMDISLTSTDRLYARPWTRRPGSKIKAKGPYYRKYKQLWTMYYRNPAVMFAVRSKFDELLFMGVNDGRVVLVPGEVPADLDGMKLMTFLNTDPRVFKYDYRPTVIHKKFILTHPATNSYLRVGRSNGVMKLACNIGKAADIDFEADFDIESIVSL